VHDVLLRQALGNLIYNAARYAGDGARVEVSLEATAGAARIVVADDGPGIPAADRGRVVERFVRLDEARTTPGSGLGLAIAAACAKLHRGQLRLEDNAPGLRAVLELAR
jgi:signal transduction histidine kinase